MKCVAAYKCFRQAAYTQHSLQVCELLCSSFQTYINSRFKSNVLSFLIAHFNTTVSTFHDWLTNQAGIQLLPLACYCADHCQLKQAVFLYSGWMPSRQANQTQTDTPSIILYCIVLYAFQKHMHFSQNKPSYFLFLLRWLYICNTGIV